jgi:phenylacetate-CoA ligase
MPPATSFPARRAILNHEFDQLQALLRLLAGSNPFYTRKFEAGGTAYKIRHLGDFGEAIPFTTRPEFIEDCRVNPPFGTNLTFPPRNYIRGHESGGAQHAPWRWLDTPESWAATVANGAEVFRSAGVGPADRIYFVSSFEQSAGACLSVESGLLFGGLCFSGAGLDSQRQWEAICATESTVVCGPLCLLREVAEAARARGCAGAPSPVRLVLTGGQPGDAAAARQAVSALWPQARVCGYYAEPEAGVVAFECPERPGILHLIEPALYPEVVDPSSGQPAELGQAGELVLTTLFRPGSPLVRFRTGVTVKLVPETACECGRHQLAFEDGLGPGSEPR